MRTRELLAHPGDVVDQPPVRDDDALGPAGGSGGVDDVRRVEVPQRGAAVAVPEVGVGARRRGLGPVEVPDGHVGIRQTGPHGAGGEQQRRPGVRQHEGDALGRVVRVDGQVGAAGLDHCEQRDRQLGRPADGDGHHVLGSQAEGHQAAGEPVGACVEFRVAEHIRTAPDGRPIGCECGLPLHEFGHEACWGIAVGAGPVPGAGPLAQEPVSFGGVQQIDAVDGDVRVGHHRVDQPDETGGHGLDRGAVEQLGVVVDHAADALGRAGRSVLLLQLEQQVELGVTGIRLHRRRFRGAEAPRRGGPDVEGQHRLEERVPVERAVGVDRLHQLLEGQVLMLVGGQVAVAHPADQLPEGRIPGEVGTEHDGVHEKADEILELLLGAARGGRAQRNVRAGPEP